MEKFLRLTAFLLVISYSSHGQVKILFDCTKAETAGNADWVIDADLHNMGWGVSGPYTCANCYHSNPQRFPTVAQNTITSSSPETIWDGALSSWAVDLVKLGYQVETLPYTGAITYGNSSNAQDLSNYKVFVVDEPNIKFTTAEKNAILAFVQNGGGLYMISDHIQSDRNGDGWDSPLIWLDLVNTFNNPFGIVPDTVTVSPTQTSLPNLPSDSLLHGPLGNVTGLKYHSGTTFHITPAANNSVVADIYQSGTTGNTGVLSAHARYGYGKVAAIGDSSPFDDGTGDPNASLYSSYATDLSGSHRKLIVNTTIWLATTQVPAQNGFGLSSTADTTICAGASLTMAAHGANSYLWTPGNYTTAIITVQPSLSGFYIVAGTTNNGTFRDTVRVVVDAFASSAVHIDTSGPTNFCTGNSVVLTCAPAGNYHWSSGAVTQSITVTQSGTYQVTVSNANNCSATAQQQVAVNVCSGISTEEGNGITLYPNPTSGIVYLQVPQGLSLPVVSIFDTSGKLVLELTARAGGKIDLDISALPAGIFVLTLNAGATEIRHRLVKM
jgi:hypothetical protein